MATQDDYIRTALRVPPGLHAQIHEAAKVNNRTFNAEIVARLEGSFTHPRDRIPGSSEEIKAFAEGVAKVLVEKGWGPKK
ncbi:Arc-like DNA binding domain-containing protein [Polaromonas sp. OV174]|uniref:Arc family DNA-binding protein n=1 Tax=Polaromonas sp. OV174 TaxID=1855300 RepID=UPI0008E32ECA|nr:Arc family DNA-binding protein [Polaromonas sp. OV174]SFB74073.1 Arc-like DNA binding domain-containing protein [Polaromonas sp. OV174]